MGQSRKSFAHFGKWLSSSVLSTNSKQQSKTLKTSQVSGTASPSEEYIEAFCQPSLLPGPIQTLEEIAGWDAAAAAAVGAAGRTPVSAALGFRLPWEDAHSARAGQVPPAWVIHVLTCKRKQLQSSMPWAVPDLSKP